MKTIDWNQHFLNQTGGQSFYRGKLYQKGYGLGGQFRRFFRWVVPLFKKNILPTLRDGAQILGKEAISTAADISKNLLTGENFKTASTERVNQAIDSLKEKIEKKIDGKGIKRKNNNINNIIFKKKKIQKTKKTETDIFSKNERKK